ncbi:MAG TPA: TlpA disulfide reductase family protein [Fulvivirga sp.]|nr:TlpA disulfide reductase family protein [Fulvivirga sp.]
MKKKISLTLIVVMGIMVQAFAQPPKPLEGQWQGLLDYKETKVPFTFELHYDNGTPIVTLVNGKERIELNKVKIIGDSIIIPMHPFDAEIRAHYDENQMMGMWKKGYKEEGIPFKANYGVPRYNPSNKNDFKLLKKLSIRFKPEGGPPYDAVGLFEQENSQVTGTILTEVGDFRYFEGIVEGDSIKMSSFDGAHGFFLTGHYVDDKWSGEFYFDSGFKEAWEGVANEQAELNSPFEEVGPGQRPYFDILTAGDPDTKIDEDKYFDKVLIIQLFGTWCPNSFDQTNYLVDWYANNQNKAVDILAVSYEANFSTQYGNQRIKDYREEMQVPYDIKLGGPMNKGQAALAFPFIDKVKAFPTLMIVDKNGFVRYMQKYFNGPATGSYYASFDREFNKIIHALLTE